MTYYEQKQHENLKYLNQLSKDLPLFTKEFFSGISDRTSVLTRINYAYDFRIFFDYLSKELLNKKMHEITLADLDNLTVTDLENYLNYLNCYQFNEHESFNNESGKSRKLSSLRSLFKYFFNKDKIKVNTVAKVSYPKKHDKEITRLDIDEVVNLLNEIENGICLTDREKRHHTRLKTRDLAIVTLLLGTGIRVSECVGLNIKDIDFKNSSFLVTRKGGHRTILYFSDEVHKALLSYYDERIQIKTKNNEEAFFISSQLTRITTRSVENIVKKYSRLVIPLKKISPHKLRSTYGTALYRETNDIYVVAEVLGHRDVNTTKKHYAAMSEETRRMASNKVKLREDT